MNTSDEAYSYGGPDSPINILMHAVNLVLATTGGPDRAREQPWLPILAAAVEAPQWAVAAKYLFHQMPKVDKAWCPYCIVDALTHFATLALVLPEAARAARNLLDGQRSKARNTAAPCRSSSWPLRPMQVCAASRAARSASAKTGAVSGMGKKPGAIALQVMPWRDQASAMARVSWVMPPLPAP